jgi:SAM-dependent methyltransferase
MIAEERPMSDMVLGSVGGQHPLAWMVDHRETYGRHVIEQFAREIADVEVVADLGAGAGDDLQIVKSVHPRCKTIALEAGAEYGKGLAGKVDEVHILNIERDVFPFSAGSVDLIVANQILEHTKEIFWILDQVFRSLKVGGHLLVGVPNVASLHNRLRLLFGVHPSQHKLCSAHVRPFSKGDTIMFLKACFPGCSVTAFAGSQFYPFPARMARLLAKALPTMAFSIFFLIRKDGDYQGEFAEYPSRAKLETNFWCGPGAGGQYLLSPAS